MVKIDQAKENVRIRMVKLVVEAELYLDNRSLRKQGATDAEINHRLKNMVERYFLDPTKAVGVVQT